MNLRRLFGLFIIIIISLNLSLIILISSPGYEEEAYTFENEVVGSYGTEINFIDEDLSDLNCSASINTGNNGLNKYIQLEDKNSSGKTSIKNFKRTEKKIDIVEFDLYKNEDENIIQIFFHETGVGRIIWLQIINNNLVTRESGSIWKTIKSNFFNNRTNYNFRIDLDDNQNEFIIRINGIKEGVFKFNARSKIGFNYLHLVTTDLNDSDFSFFIDNVRYKWIQVLNVIISIIILIVEFVFLVIITLYLILNKINKKARHKNQQKYNE